MLSAAARICCSHSSSSSSSVRTLRRRLFSILRSSSLSSSNATKTANSYGKPKQLSTTTANGGGGGSWAFHINMVNHPMRWSRRSKRGYSTTASVTDAIEESNTFVSVEIRCQKDVAGMLSEAVLCFGASSASIDQSSSSVGDSDEICITSIFTNGKDVDTCISCAADSIGLENTPAYEIRAGEEHNWLKNAEESFHPIKVSTGLWIVPQWRTPPEPQAINVILNPGMAFGTGDHPTTKLCLLLLKSLIKGGESLLDYGTGSGILGIAALKLGGSISVGIDIDPQAISYAQKNIVLNHIPTDKMQLYLGDSRVTPLSPDNTSNNEKKDQMVSSGSPLRHRRGEFDIILANILLNPLVELAEDIVSYAKPGAVIGLSGILIEQLPRIEYCYSRYLERISTSEMDGWACLSGTRKME